MKKTNEKEYLRQQLELLSKVSQRSHSEFLPGITSAMCKIYLLIKIVPIAVIALLVAMTAYLFVNLIIFIQ